MSEVYQWLCPLESCNHEQGPYQVNEADCETAFAAHLNGHSNVHFVPFVLAGDWRKAFKLTPA